MDVLDRILAHLTNLTWVSSRQSYRLNGPPGSYSSAEVSVSRGRMVFEPDKDEAQEALDEEVRDACEQRMPQVMHTLADFVEEQD